MARGTETGAQSASDTRGRFERDGADTSPNRSASDVRDRHHQDGDDRADDLAGRGVAHRAGHEAADRGGDGAGHDEDQDRGDHVRQVGADRRDEVVEGGDAELGHRDGECTEEDEPVRQRADRARRTFKVEAYLQCPWSRTELH